MRGRGERGKGRDRQTDRQTETDVRGAGERVGGQRQTDKQTDRHRPERGRREDGRGREAGEGEKEWEEE